MVYLLANFCYTLLIRGKKTWQKWWSGNELWFWRTKEFIWRQQNWRL